MTKIETMKSNNNSIVTPQSRASRSKRFSAKHSIPWLFLSPFIILNCIFFLYPFINSIILSFHQTNGPTSSVYVGFGNFTFALSDPTFYQALWNTTIYTIGSLFIQLPLSLFLALLLNSKKDKMKGFFRLLLFSPNLVGQVFVGVLFSVLFIPRYGLFNQFVQSLLGWGLEINWLQDPNLVMPAMIIVSLWLHTGFNMIYFLAALQNVDDNLIEAALLDGANKFQIFWHVILPSIKSVTVFVVLMSLIGSYKLFELPYAMLRGYGPKNSGLTIVGYLYKTAFENGDLGMGAAIGWLLAILLMTLSLFQLWITKATEKD